MKTKNVVVQLTLSIGKSGDEVELSSPAWFAWLRDASVFYYQGENATFTARKQPRRGTMYWYAYARQAGLLHCIYIGRTEDLTVERLKDVAGRLRANVDARRATITADIMDSHARAVRQTAVLLEQLFAEQGSMSVSVAQQQLEDLQLLVGQNHRLTKQELCYALDLLAAVLDELRTVSKRAAHERERLLEEVHQLRSVLPLTNSPLPNVTIHNEVF